MAARTPADGVAGGPGPAADGAVAEGAFHLKKRSKAPYILVAVGLVIAGGMGVVLMMQGNAPQDTSEPVVAESPEDRQAKRRQQLEQQLAGVLSFARDNPDDYRGVQGRLNSFTILAKDFPELVANARRELEQVEERGKTAAEQYWSDFQAQLFDLQKREDFAAAVTLFSSYPPVFEHFGDTARQEEFIALRRQAKVDLVAMEYLRELRLKAARYVQQQDVEIAKAIINCFPEKYESDAPLVWGSLQAFLKEVARTGIEQQLEGERVVEAEAQRRREERLRREAELREQRWTALKESTPWANQLGRYGLYNWVVTSDRSMELEMGSGQPKWGYRTEGEDAVLLCDNRTGGTLFKGFFTNFWQDYVVQFDVRLHEGTLQLSPRTQARDLSGVQPASTETSTLIELEAGTQIPKGEWVTVTLEVHGDHARLTCNERPDLTIEIDGDEDRLLSEGGILFMVPDQSKVELRRVKTRLVTHSREKLF